MSWNAREFHTYYVESSVSSKNEPADMTASGITELVSSLYETWYGSVVRYAARRMGSIQAAEDIVQEAFMQL